MTLKTVRDPTLPSVPPEEEKDDFERITRFRKGQLTTFQELQENVYDDLSRLEDLPVYANNAAALAGDLKVGAFYRTGGDPDPVCVVH